MPNLSRIALPCLTAAALACSAGAQVSFTGLGNMPIGINSTVMGMSRNGQYVVGMLAGSGFAWSPGVGFQYPLGNALYDASDNGFFSGLFSPVGALYQWNVSGGHVEAYSQMRGPATAISQDGSLVCGQGQIYSTTPAPSGTLQTTIPGVGDAASLLGFRMSADGSVVTWSQIGAVSHGLRWSAAGGSVDITDSDYKGLAFNGLSEDGSILVGWGDSIIGPAAVRWRPSDGLQCLGILNSFTGASTALGVSADGNVVVGQSIDSVPLKSTAFFWTPETGMVDLGQYLSQNGVHSADLWTLESAVAVSADGKKIAGYGIDQSGNTQGFYATISPPRHVDSIGVAQVALNPSPRVGGNDLSCTVTLAQPAPSSGARVSLAGIDPEISAKPTGLFGGGGGVIVAGGHTKAIGQFSTLGVSAPTLERIEAVSGNAVRFGTVLLLPASLRTPTLTSASVIGGSSVQLTLPLNGEAPQTGGAVGLKSSNPGVASLPSTADYSAYGKSVSVNVSTQPVLTPTPVTITATYRGNKRQVVLTVNP